MGLPEIRMATEADAPAILDLWLTSNAPRSTTDDRQSLARAISMQTVLVADDEDTVVASLIAAFDGWRGNMYRLVVDPAYRRRGLGLALVQAGERRLEALGCRRITALVLRSDPPAIGFWINAGYRVDERVKRLVKSNAAHS